MINELVIIQVSNYYESVTGRAFLRIKDDKSIIEYLIARLQQHHKDICIATSKEKEDDVFEEVASKQSISIYRGELENIPERLVCAAKQCGAKDFIRVYAYYPFIDIALMDELYMLHVQNKYDYSYNEHLHGVLWGTGCDVFNVSFLERIGNNKLTDSQMLTIGAYIRQNANRYNVFEYQYGNKRPGYKLSVEGEKDFEVVKEIAQNLSEISCASITAYLDNNTILSKYNLEAPPKEAGVEKLFLNSAKTDNILHKHFPDLTYPISVEMTLTNACNLNCVYCSDAMLRAKQGMTEQISLDDFKRLFADLARGGTKGVVIEGGGEPTLYSHFDEVVDYARNSGLAVGLITNGSIRLPKTTLSKFEWIRVSLDASTPSEYENLKGVNLYEKIIDNIAYYAKYCSTVGVGYVVTSQNISQIETLVMRLRELKASYIQLRPVVDCEELYPYDIDLSYLKFYMTKDFGVQVDGMIENSISGNRALPCYASSITSIISGDGSVYICGRLNIYDWLKPIGNIRKQSFSEIWNGEERKRQLEMIADKKFCGEYCPQCRVTKFNVLFDKLYAIKSTHFI